MCATYRFIQACIATPNPHSSDPEVLPDAEEASVIDDAVYATLLDHALVRDSPSEVVVAALQALLQRAFLRPDFYAPR